MTKYTGKDNYSFKNRVGQSIGDLTALEYHSTPKTGGSLWIMRCSCGAVVIRAWSALHAKLQYKLLPITCGHHKIKDPLKVKLYAVWQGMKTRCYNANNYDYRYYGARGIGICSEWLSFNKFFLDMSSSYVPGKSIERIDNDLGYSHANCTWATPVEQIANRRCSVYVETPFGILSAKEAAEIYSVSITTIYNWISSGRLLKI